MNLDPRKILLGRGQGHAHSSRSTDQVRYWGTLTDAQHQELSRAHTDAHTVGREIRERQVMGGQVMALALPLLGWLVTAGLFAWPGSLAIDDVQMGRISSLCASLLATATIEAGIVAAVGVASAVRAVRFDPDSYSVEPSDELRDDLGYMVESDHWEDARKEIVELAADLEAEERFAARTVKRFRYAGGGILVLETLCIVAAIVTGALVDSGQWAEIICVQGLIIAVALLFSIPLSLAIARLKDRTFLLEKGTTG